MCYLVLTFSSSYCPHTDVGVRGYQFLTTITLYCLLYLPMVLWYLRHLLHNDYELPPIIIGTARFLPPDAPTTPPVVLTSCFVLPGDIRAHNYDQVGWYP